jgi:hypothetical protein
VIYLYEKLQRFVLKTFELSFLELLILGFPISMFTIIGTLAGLEVSPVWPILVVTIGGVWVLSYIMMWILTPVWTIPIYENPVIEKVKSFTRR